MKPISDFVEDNNESRTKAFNALLDFVFNEEGDWLYEEKVTTDGNGYFQAINKLIDDVAVIGYKKAPI